MNWPSGSWCFCGVDDGPDLGTVCPEVNPRTALRCNHFPPGHVTQDVRRAAHYFRVSTHGQSVEAQRPDVEGFSQARGFDLVAVFEDVASGAKTDRAQLRAMLEAAHRRAFDVLVVWKLDRLGRSMTDVLATVSKLDRAGVELFSVREPWLDLHGPMRPLLLAVFAWLAEWERDAGIERTRAGMAVAKRAGRPIGRPQKAIPMTIARALLGEDGASVRAVARRLKLAPSTLRRALKRDASSTPADDAGDVSI